eukprot:2442709-Prorocentrum_lima.AAC.1
MKKRTGMRCWSRRAPREEPPVFDLLLDPYPVPISARSSASSGMGRVASCSRPEARPRDAETQHKVREHQ